MESKKAYKLNNKQIDSLSIWMKRFPSNNKESAIIYALHLIQNETKYLKDEHIEAVANYLEVENIDVYENASFYSMFELQEIGKHTISVCTNVSCMLNGSDKILSYIENKLGIKVGQSTDQYYLKDERECLAACCGSPVMQVDHKYYEDLTEEKIDNIFRSLDNEE
ncbi:MAG: NADH-quinone oxidoreductase subunit NuoE [Pseudomonadota bacterium]|nr:NADH-quinone oxidoreductase subunit NuoE [Pseudomonadota bacterium]